MPAWDQEGYQCDTGATAPDRYICSSKAHVPDAPAAPVSAVSEDRGQQSKGISADVTDDPGHVLPADDPFFREVRLLPKILLPATSHVSSVIE